MDWTPGGISDDIEDRRESGGGFGGMGGGGIGIVGFVILLLISLFTGRNYLGRVLSGGGQSSVRAGVPSSRPGNSFDEHRDVQLVSFVLDDVQRTWTQVFAAHGRTYRHAKLVLFRDATYSACGTAQEATGPFYCPADEKVYIDLAFWGDLKRFGGDTGDFAQAYVVAHELGHHVQKLLGVESRVHRLEQEHPSESNHLSVDLELQADCLAGVWGHSTEQRDIVHPDDIDAALKTAAAVGDDHLQRMNGRAVSPERWTHGSSAQRSEWFRRGLQGGTVASCATFQGSLTP
jgi:predicted metalloprotease